MRAIAPSIRQIGICPESSARLDYISPSRTAIAPEPALAVRVLILKADRLYSEMLRNVAQLAIPGATVTLAASLAEVRDQLADHPVDLLVSGVAVRDGDVLDILPEWLGAGKPVRNAFVITERKEPYTLYVLSKLPLLGVFDQLAEGLTALNRALAQVSVGERYWSPTIVESIAAHCLPPTSVCRILTDAEKRVFAVIGDGSDDAAAAKRLGVKKSTVTSVRRSLHRKLGVQHKGELLRLAIQLGFVRISAAEQFDNVSSRTGYAATAVAHLAARRRA